MDKRLFNIALDGPAGAGKSSVADALAKHYGLIHLDTGAMYRGAALYLSGLDIEPKEGEELEKALENMDMHFENGDLIINGHNVAGKIRRPEVSRLASLYSALKPVRKRLVALQQKIAADKGYIVDGRDICDVVLPDAEVKLYLDASARARAMRRMKQDEEKGISQKFEDVLKDIEERDYRDMHRKESPLKVSEEAVVIDTSNLNLEQSIQAIEQAVQAALEKGLQTSC